MPVPLDVETTTNGLEVQLNSGAPISKLHDDILWSIFTINAETPPSETYFPLTTTRNSSQVRRSWRELILRSSSLWGKLIDLDLLDQENDDWRREVVRRSRTSLLWIRGRVTSSTLREFLFSLMSDDWGRIQKLDIHMEIRENMHEENSKAWNMLTHSAPNLQVFKLSSRYSTHLLPTSSSPLLGTSSPALREFNAPGMTFSLKAPWLSNIRCMSFSPPFTVPDIFEALKAMPCLEDLAIRSAPWVPTAKVIFPDVHLPRLQNLRLRGRLSLCRPFLDNIIASSGCSLSLVTKNPGTTIPELDMSEVAHQSISRYIQPYKKSDEKKQIFIRCSGDDLTIHDHKRVDTPLYFSHSFSWGIYGYPNLSTLLLKELSQFSNVTEMDLGLMNIRQLSSKIALNLSSFRFLEVLETNDETLKFLLDHADETPNIFPALHTIKLAGLNPPEHDSDPYPAEIILPFFIRRQESGHPISIFDLSNFSFHQLYDMDFLNVLTGMKVVWRHPTDGLMEYECGSKGSENLRFRSSWLPSSSQ
ncbi:hypothetical protein GALMADRAFT_258572 [Galerina marginata CBS 339.88]|uniref:F-box domain-containing protein n=1 Tax=Galerina marginata (strain CBS 339.88) TaxID=685588 RepID=A0A067SHH6_GALM3|nr:hypothetical protein GALMADRAFT_258572 [Galerina marginata CBS 339.88]